MAKPVTILYLWDYTGADSFPTPNPTWWPDEDDSTLLHEAERRVRPRLHNDGRHQRLALQLRGVTTSERLSECLQGCHPGEFGMVSTDSLDGYQAFPPTSLVESGWAAPANH